MKRTRLLVILCILTMVATSLSMVPAALAAEAPLEIRIAYDDNPTLPFDPDWLSLKLAQEFTNTKLSFEVIPNTDWTEKIKAMLNSGTAPDVLLYTSASIAAEYGQNGALLPINEYKEYLPNYFRLIEDWGLQEDLQDRYTANGNLYYMPAIYDFPFYDGGPILRTDLLEEYGLAIPETYEDLYNVAKVYKEHFPDSYPVTNLVDSRVTFRMTMPGFGISLGLNASTASHVLSYDYEKKEFFPGATSDLYREYLRYMSKMYAEGLLDPEFANASDVWTTKMSTGAAMISFAYYDQIGGLVANSEIPNISFNMIPPLKGPVGAYHQPKSRTGTGISFPATTLERRGEEELKKIMSAIDAMFFSDEMSEMWCLGVEGETFTRDGDKVTFNEKIMASRDGPYKAMQLLYGMGCDPLQLVWINAREMYKYDEYYGNLNKTVAEMKAIQPIPPLPKFTADENEEVNLMKAPLIDWFDRWTNDFIRGAKSVETDWDAFVKEGQDLGIDEMCAKYNEVFNR